MGGSVCQSGSHVTQSTRADGVKSHVISSSGNSNGLPRSWAMEMGYRWGEGWGHSTYLDQSLKKILHLAFSFLVSNYFFLIQNSSDYKKLKTCCLYLRPQTEWKPIEQKMKCSNKPTNAFWKDPWVSGRIKGRADYASRENQEEKIVGNSTE